MAGGDVEGDEQRRKETLSWGSRTTQSKTAGGAPGLQKQFFETLRIGKLLHGDHFELTGWLRVTRLSV